MRTRRVFAVLLVVVALVLSGTVAVGFQAYKGTLEAQSRDEMRMTARQVQSQLDARLAGLRRTVELHAERPHVADHGTSRQRRALSDLVEHSAFSGASVIAADGTMTNIVAGLAPDERRSLVGRDFGDRTYHKRAMHGETYVSEPLRADSGHYIVTVSAPIRENGTVVGTLNAALHLTDAGLFAAATRGVGEHEGVTVVADSGTVVYAREPTPARALVSREVAMRETDWTVRVSRSRAVVAAQVRRITHMQVGGVLAVLASILGFGWWVDRRNLRQMERLVEGFEALENGEYGTTVDVGGSEGWDKVRAGFNTASRTLADVIAERRQRERDLRRFRRTIEATAHAIYITDTDGTIEYVNDAFVEVTGYDRSEALGQTPHILNSGEQDDEYYRRLWGTITSGDVWDEDIVNRRRSGETYYAHQTIAPIHDDGAIEGYVAIQSDITEHRERQRQLEILDRVLRHNLQNDMNVIRGHAELVRDRGTGELVTNAEQIIDQSDGLLRTADKERRIIEVLSEDPRPEPADVASLAHSVVETARAAHPEATLDVDVDGADRTRALVTDNFGRALEELVENAVTHSDRPHPEVTVTVVGTAESVQVRVADDGPGIPEQERAVLTGEHEIGPLFHGSGLGLWLVYWIVRRSNGTLRFEANEPRGSVVTVSVERA